MEPLRVLLVDDESELVETLVERLQVRKMEAEGVTTGWEALNLIKEKTFDVLLADVKMPGMSGLKLLQEVKDLKPDLPVILLTGHGSMDDAHEGMRRGAFDYLTKPLNINNLVKTLYKAAAREPAENP